MSHRGRRRHVPSPNELDPSSIFGSFASPDTRRGERKEKQLCRQVLEALSYTLPSLNDDILQDCWLVDVEPAPDASRLCAVIQARAGLEERTVLERLEKFTGAFRGEVAQAIHRKRVPTLTFRVAVDDANEALEGGALEQGEP